MTNEDTNTKEQTFDLEERTARFGEKVIQFVKTVRLTPVTDSLVRQLVRAATSIGANYCEANDAQSKKDFRHKISLCRNEAKETKHWLRMIAAADESTQQPARELWQEAKELNLVFSSIVKNTRIQA